MLNDILLPMDRFETESLTGLKNRNYIFGKNGTGKSTIVQQLIEQCSEEYDVQVFNGFAGIIKENDGLESIALGAPNTELLSQITQLKKEIREKQILISKEDEGDVYSAWLDSENEYKNEQAIHYDLLKEEGKRIFNRSELKLSRSFNRKDLIAYKNKNANEMNRLSDQKESEMLAMLHVSELGDISVDVNIFTEVEKFITIVNDIRGRSITKSLILGFSGEEERWVEVGRKLHKYHQKCLFCDNDIDEQRLSQLDDYFNVEIEELQNDISKNSQQLHRLKQRLTKYPIFTNKDIYPKLQGLNNKIAEEQSKVLPRFLLMVDQLIEGLDEKDASKFSELRPVDIHMIDISEMVQDLLTLQQQQKQIRESINEEQNEARELLKNHFMQVAVTKKEVVESFAKVQSAKNRLDEDTNKYERIKKDIREKEERLKELVALCVDEQEAANRINDDLLSLGNTSFTLEYVKPDDDMIMKGQYQIKGKDGKIRSVSKLSTGEKNIIAFLWFLNQLSVDNDIEKRIIIFDDPMDSNDDATQYLIIAKLNRLLRDLGDEKNVKTLILTHNVHFYMQIRSRKYRNHPHFMLIKQGDLTNVVSIDNKTDITSIYELLWEELIFAKDNAKINFMWNTMRRILESYARFLFAEESPAKLVEHINDDGKGAATSIYYEALLKSLHVNSHIGYETDIDLSDTSVSKLWSDFEQVFRSLGEMAYEHFTIYSTLNRCD